MNLAAQDWPIDWVYDGFEELCRALCLDEDASVTVLRILGDAGGKKQASNLTVGAYIATVHQWDKRIKPLWIGALQDEAVECFHRTDMEIPAHGEFDRETWTRDHQIAVLNRLHKIIRDHTMNGQGHGVDAIAFERLVPPEVKRDYGGPYGICVLQTVVHFGLRARQRDEWIHYIFEAGDEGQGQINTVMAKIIGDPRYRDLFRVADFTFGVKRGPCAIVQLQTADFLAFESYKRIENYLAGEPRKPRLSFNALLRPRIDVVMLWTEESIGAWLARLNQLHGDVIESMISRHVDLR